MVHVKKFTRTYCSLYVSVRGFMFSTLHLAAVLEMTYSSNVKTHFPVVVILHIGGNEIERSCCLSVNFKNDTVEEKLLYVFVYCSIFLGFVKRFLG